MTTDDATGGEIIPPQPAAPEGAGYDSSGKSPQQIENDIVETRAQLGELLDELERRLAPRQLLEKGVDMLKDTMSGDGGRLGETLRSHPVPLALIGIGVGWMLMAGTAGRTRLGEYGSDLRDRVSGALQDAGARAGEFAGQIKDKVTGAARAAPSSPPYPTESSGYAYARQKSGEAMDRAQQAAQSAGSAVQDKMRQAQDAGKAAWRRASDYAQTAGDRLSGARDRFSELIEDHPLAVGALGFLAGTVIAMMLPRTETEERYIGPTSQQLRDQAASLGSEAVDRAQHVAERTVDAAVDAVKEAVNEASDAMAGKAEHASGESAKG